MESDAKKEENKYNENDDNDDEDDSENSGPPENKSSDSPKEDNVEEDDDIDDDASESGEEEKKDQSEPYSKEALPDHFCRYCWIHEPTCVVKCIDKGCNKWFCNDPTLCGSHIVHHLVRAKHKEISLHQSSLLGDTPLECYNCENKNVFQLGYVHAKNEKQTILLLCRECHGQSSMKDETWDFTGWMPMIEERSLVTWVARRASTEVSKRSKQLTIAQMCKLEELWQSNPKANHDDLNGKVVEELIDRVKLRYHDAYEYQQTYNPLIKLEAEYDKKMKESQTQSGIKIRWEWSINKKRVAYFVFPKEENGT